MPRAFRWCLALLAYLTITVYFLRAALPGSYCAYGGRSPGLWWGKFFEIGQYEYLRHPRYYELLILLPHLAAGLLLTLSGSAVAYATAQRFRASMLASRPVIASILTTLGLTVSLALVSDAGILSRFWGAPRFLLHDAYGSYITGSYITLVALPKIFLPPAFLSGLVTFCRVKRWL